MLPEEKMYKITIKHLELISYLRANKTYTNCVLKYRTITACKSLFFSRLGQDDAMSTGRRKVTNVYTPAHAKPWRQRRYNPGQKSLKLF